jgi:hypothetical protein
VHRRPMTADDLEIRDETAAGISSPCFNSLKQEELALRYEEFRFASETSHAGIIRIGFEGISQPHIVEHPCFNDTN